MEQIYDYSDYEEPVRGSVTHDLSRLGEELRQAQAELETQELQLKRAKERVEDLSEKIIPELMDKLGFQEFVTNSGFRIKITENVYVSVSREKRSAVIKWLDDNGHGGMVKRNVTIAFNRDQEDRAKKLLTDLSKDYPGVKEESKVEPSTLRSWVTKRLESGLDVPLDLINVHTAKIAKI